VRLRVPEEAAAFVTLRRVADCKVEQRFRVDLTRSRGAIVIRGSVNRHRLPAGVYLVRVSRDAQESNSLRTLVVRVARNGQVKRTMRDPRTLCAPASPLLTLAWGGSAALASMPVPRVPGPSVRRTQPPAPSPGKHAAALGARHSNPIAGIPPQPSSPWGTVLVFGFVGSLLLALAAWIWRFFQTTPAAPQ
jgi:hypothetical protein